MAEERGYYQLEEQPAFKEQVERLLNSDEVRAEGSQFESLLLSMLNNIKAAYQKAGSVADGVGKPGGAASLDETGKVPANQIPDLSGQYETLRPMSLLESGTDLNTLTTPGTYGTAGSSVTASLINAPETTGYMSMTVRRAYSNAMLVQEYFIWTSSTTFSLYYRTKWNSSSDWAQWQQVYTSGDKPTAEDIGAIPASQKGVANGVASLDDTGKVPSGQLPDLSGQYEALYPLQILSDGTDLNTIKTPGTYGGDTSKLVNAPKDSGQCLLVVRRNGSAQIWQEFYYFSGTDPSKFYRDYTSSTEDTWTPWQEEFTPVWDYYGMGSGVDIDDITDDYMLVSSAISKDCPVGGSFVFIMQFFYGKILNSNLRIQIAYGVAGGTSVPSSAYGMAIRRYSNSTWGEWEEIYTTSNKPTAAEVGAIANPAGGTTGQVLTKTDGGAAWGDESKGRRTARFTVGTSSAGWTADDVDYLCDGTEDDVEINAAITALPSGGGEIVLLDGTYNITASVAISKANVTLRGNGNATILKRMFNGDSTNGVIDVSAANVQIMDLAINDNRSSYSDTRNRGIDASTSSDGICIENVTVSMPRIGICLDSITGGRIVGCKIQTSSYGSIELERASNILLEGNYLEGNGGDGILVGQSGACSNIQIVNNRIGTTVDSCININRGSECVVSGNICGDSDASGIYLYDASKCAISENVCDSINLSSRTTENVVVGNILRSGVNNSGTGNILSDNIGAS